MRLFIAISASEEICRASSAVIESLKPFAPDYRWVEPRDRHVTLRFLGEIPENRIPEMIELMENVARPLAPFDLGFGRVGAFDSVEDPRVIWLGLRQGESTAAALAQALGREEPRPYAPHLTLGRRRGQDSMKELKNVLLSAPELAVTQRVDRISLYASVPASFGHVYHVLREVLFGGDSR